MVVGSNPAVPTNSNFDNLQDPGFKSLQPAITDCGRSLRVGSWRFQCARAQSGPQSQIAVVRSGLEAGASKTPGLTHPDWFFSDFVSAQTCSPNACVGLPLRGDIPVKLP